MTFGEKLQKLRKEKGMSQEELANQLNVSRQAVSKWENDQGFPETEKMLMIGNIFSTSMDYLLKEDTQPQANTERGYYASREVVQGYLQKDRKEAKRIAIGVLMFILSGLPMLIFPKFEDELSIISFIIIALGVALFVSMGFEEETYKMIKKEPLVFDREYLTQVREHYKVLSKKLKNLIVAGIMMFFLTGAIAILVDDTFRVAKERAEIFDGIYLLLIGIGVFMIVYASCIMSGYEVIIDNDKYQQERHGYEWVYYVTIGIASIIYIGIGMVYGKMFWRTGWVIVVITWIITYAVIRVLNDRKERL